MFYDVDTKIWVENRVIESSLNTMAFEELEGKILYVTKFFGIWEFRQKEKLIGRYVVEFLKKRDLGLSYETI